MPRKTRAQQDAADRNEERAQRAQVALEAFGTVCDSDAEDIVVDLITNVLHRWRIELGDLTANAFKPAF